MRSWLTLPWPPMRRMVLDMVEAGGVKGLVVIDFGEYVRDLCGTSGSDMFLDTTSAQLQIYMLGLMFVIGLLA